MPAPATQMNTRSISMQCFGTIRTTWLGGVFYAGRLSIVNATPAQAQLLLNTRGTTPDLVADPKRNGHLWLLTQRDDFEWLVAPEQAWLAANTDPETVVTAEGLV